MVEEKRVVEATFKVEPEELREIWNNPLEFYKNLLNEIPNEWRTSNPTATELVETIISAQKEKCKTLLALERTHDKKRREGASTESSWNQYLSNQDTFEINTPGSNSPVLNDDGELLIPESSIDSKNISQGSSTGEDGELVIAESSMESKNMSQGTQGSGSGEDGDLVIAESSQESKSMSQGTQGSETDENSALGRTYDISRNSDPDDSSSVFSDQTNQLNVTQSLGPAKAGNRLEETFTLEPEKMETESSQENEDPAPKVVHPLRSYSSVLKMAPSSSRSAFVGAGDDSKSGQEKTETGKRKGEQKLSITLTCKMKNILFFRTTKSLFNGYFRSFM